MKAVNVIKVMNTIANFMFLTNFPPSLMIDPMKRVPKEEGVLILIRDNACA